MFGPLRTLGVPEPVIDVVEPFFRVIVELGYDRSIPPWEPTPARLIPTLDPATVAADLVDAIGEGINNARGPGRLASAAEKSFAGSAFGHRGVKTQSNMDVPSQASSIETSTRHDEVTSTERRGCGAAPNSRRPSMLLRFQDFGGCLHIRADEPCRAASGESTTGAGG